MISEIIAFKLRAGMTRAEVVAPYRKTAPVWRSGPDRIRKGYLFDAGNHRGGSAYLCKSLAGAKRPHGEAWRRMIDGLYGGEGQITIATFETPVVADNLAQATIEEAEVAGRAA